MARRPHRLDLAALAPLDRRHGPLARQLAEALRRAIQAHALHAGDRLPSSRALATGLGVARGVVVEAFEQLCAEGYLEARAGAGTRVALSLPSAARHLSAARSPPPASRLPESAARYAALAQMLAPLPPRPFAIAVPEGALRPDEAWRRLGNRLRASQEAAPAGYGDPRGVPVLREAIAEYVRQARAVECTPDQVIVTSGTQQGLFLATRVLLSPGAPAWVEEPAYPGLSAVLEDHRVALHRVALDREGVRVSDGVAACPEARAAFVTPSHQYPLGMPLSLSRRQALLSWARQADAWIVEDDYDSELRYAGHPIPSLQGLDPSRVVYLGTFSKVLYPSLRLGYLIAPPALVPAFVGARVLIDRHVGSAAQYKVAAALRSGWLARHIRRVRGVYAEQRALLLKAIDEALASWVTVQSSDQGLHLLLWLADGLDDRRVSAAAAQAGIALRPLSPMYGGPRRRHGLLLGFGGFAPDDLLQAVRGLRAVLQAVARDGGG